jgi:hypothetical protein
MDASLPKQISVAAPVWVWDGHWWPGVVADARFARKFIIARLENGVTLPVQRTRLQPRDPMRHGDDRPRRPHG